jgi:opacity protein-like surface antigen
MTQGMRSRLIADAVDAQRQPSCNALRLTHVTVSHDGGFDLNRDLIRSLVAALVCVVALSVAASPVRAQSVAQPRSWTVTPFLHTSVGIGDPAPHDSVGVGVAVAYDWTYNLGFEGEIGHLFDVAGDTNVVDWSVSNFSANAVYHFDVKRFTPYATLGIGIERSSQDIKDPDPLALITDFSSTEVAFNFGGGVKYPINARWVARGDVRRFQANDIAPDFWRLYGGLTFVMKK